MKIHFKVREQTLWAYGCESPVGGSIDYISCEFEFLTKDWDNVPGRYAVFTLKDTDPAVSYTAVIVDGKIDEDAHINLSDGIWNVNVVGVSEEGQRITTCDCPILVDKPSIQLPMFPEIKQDVGEKILAVAGEAKKQVDHAIEKVDEAIEKVDNLTEIANTVEDSANRAAASADEANQSAILAESAKENAIASENTANVAANAAIGALKEADAAAARAKESAAKALASEDNAKTSESNAKKSENESKATLESVKELEKTASDKADEAAVSAANAKDSENAASESANSAAESAEIAKSFEGKQADWYQNDINAKDYVKNKTHWVETNIVRKELTFSKPDNSSGATRTDMEFATALFEHQDSLTISENGNLLDIESVTVSDGGIRFITKSYKTGPTTGAMGRIWCTLVLADSSVTGNIRVSDGLYEGWSNVVLTLEYEEPIVHQLDEKFIPDTIARTADIPVGTMVVNITDNEDDTLCADKTFEEIQNWYKSGGNVCARTNDGMIWNCINVESVIVFSIVAMGNNITLIMNPDSSFDIQNVTYESVENMTFSISEDSTDDEYPSAKAVYDALSNAGGTLYVNVTWGSTITADKTFAEMKAAIDAGKNVIAIVDDLVLSVVIAESREIAFGVVMISGETGHPYHGLLFLTCNSDNVWRVLEGSIEQPGNKITALSADSTDTQYPSAKAVYDFVNTNLGDIKTLIDGM